MSIAVLACCRGEQRREPPGMGFDDAILWEYMTGFYGYGDYCADCWLVGMEEGGGSTVDEIARRLDTWRNGGRSELADLVNFHNEADLGDWVRPNPPWQRTWAGLIRFLLAGQGSLSATDDI